jgi:hypothetical protein
VPRTKRRGRPPLAPSRPQFAAIVWEPSAELDDAIVAVAGVTSPGAGVEFALAHALPGTQWAVVDLATRQSVRGASVAG